MTSPHRRLKIAIAACCAGCGVILALLLGALSVDLAGSLVPVSALEFIVVIVAVGMWLVAASRQYKLLAVTAAVWALASTGACVGGMMVRSAQERRAQERGDRLVLSLERHRERTGRYPAALSELTPIELSSVPTTGLGALHDEPFSYRSDGQDFSLGHSADKFGFCSRGARDRWHCVW